MNRLLRVLVPILCAAVLLHLPACDTGSDSDSSLVVDWDERFPGNVPPARFAHAMDFDPANGEVLLFGGTANANAADFGDTWTWDGADWTQKNPSAPNPSAREDHDVVFATLPVASPGGDPAGRERIVLFGGFDGTSRLDETWEWDGSASSGAGAWVQISPGTSPPVLRGHALAFGTLQAGTGAPRDRVVLFGGDGSGGLSNDLWEYDGDTWSQQSLSPSPSPRSGHDLVFDSNRGVVVLFGGVDSGGNRLDDTWEYDGSQWTQIAPPTRPPSREGHSMVFDPNRGVVGLFGGINAQGVLDDTWAWNGTDWGQVVPTTTPPTTPPGRQVHDAAFQTNSNLSVIFGGGDASLNALDDTWELTVQ